MALAARTVVTVRARKWPLTCMGHHVPLQAPKRVACVAEKIAAERFWRSSVEAVLHALTLPYQLPRARMSIMSANHVFQVSVQILVIRANNGQRDVVAAVSPSTDVTFLQGQRVFSRPTTAARGSHGRGASCGCECSLRSGR